MNIVIADDEYYARKAVVQMVIDWDATAVLWEAEDGTEALALIEQHRPDLVLTDIRMPGLDGIQLAAHIQQHYPETLVAIISGFDDFAYAQEAIRYKVEHYMLKPMNRQELYPLLERLRDTTKQSRSVAAEKALAAALYNKDITPITQLHEAFGGNDQAPYRTAAVCIPAHSRDLLRRVADEVLKRRGYHAIVMNDRRREHILIVSLFQLKGTQADHRNPLKLLFEEISAKFSEALDDSQLRTAVAIAAAGISSAHTGYSELSESFREAKLALVQSMMQQKHQLAFHEDTAGEAKYNAGIIHEWIEIFGRRLARQQATEASAMVSEWLNEAAAKHYSAYMLQDWYASTVRAINTLIERAYEHAAADLFMEQQSLLDFHSIEQAGDALIDRLVAASEQLKRSEERTDIVASIKEFVDTHYPTRIQLEELAKDKYFVDPGYLSRLFKRKSGMKFSTYLLNVRMEKAKQLLEKAPDLPVSEVAAEVGFNDYSYFIQTYKKVFGETPGKFRSNLGLQE